MKQLMLAANIRSVFSGSSSIERPAAEPSANDFHVSSIEAWPAAGGGLLLGAIVQAISGRAQKRNTVKTLFLRLGLDCLPTVIIPYVCLEPEVASCVAEVVAAEFGSDAGQVTIDNNVNHSTSAAVALLVDLSPAFELNLVVLAAIARTLLATVTETISLCENGRERDREADGAQRSPSLSDLVMDAALLGLPPVITLRSGRRISLRTDGESHIAGRNT